MPIDALTEATNQLAPGRASTNFFDPTAGATVVARYAASRTAGEGVEALTNSASRIMQTRMAQERERRDLIKFDRDDQEYQEKQDFKQVRGTFLRSLNTLDPQDPDYTLKRNQILAEMPPGARDDDATTAIMSSLDADYHSVQTERERRDASQFNYDQRRKLQQEKAKTRFGEMGLPPEEMVFDEEGNLDEVETAFRAGRAAGAEKKADSKEMIAERAKASSDAQSAKTAELDRRKSVAEIGVKDQGAFPSQTIDFATKNPNFDPTDYDTKSPEAVKMAQTAMEAKDYEKNKLQSEMASALSREKPEDYIELVPNATPAQKKKRLDLWNLAHEMAGNAAPAPTTTDAPVAPKPSGITPDKLVVGKKYTGANGQVRTYKGNGQWE